MLLTGLELTPEAQILYPQEVQINYRIVENVERDVATPFVITFLKPEFICCP